MTPKQRRQEDRSRFQTQVLTNESPETVAVNGQKESQVPQSAKVGVRSSIPMLKKFSVAKMHKNVKTENVPEEVESSLKLDKFSANKESADLPKRMNVQDNDCAQELSSDDAKLKCEEMEDLGSTDNLHFDSGDSEDSDVEDKQTKGPRIMKPGMLTRHLSVESNPGGKTDFEVPKGIRGKRKPLYSSPNSRKPTPQSSPLKVIIFNMYRLLCRKVKEYVITISQR